MTRVPVLCYHAVSDLPSQWIAGMTVTPTQFREHVETLTALGRVPIAPAALADALAGRRALPAGAVVVTFDDGFAGVATAAAPVLAEAGFPAGIYITTGVVGGRSPGGDLMLTWSQIDELATAGFEIGGHTHLHHQLDAVPVAVARADILQCRDRLADRLGRPVEGFAYPHGYSSPRVRRIVRNAGFGHAYAVRNTVSTETDDVYAIPRLTVTADVDGARLAAWLEDRALPFQPWPRPLLVAGWRAYRRLRARRGTPSPWIAGMPPTEPSSGTSDPLLIA